jgi:hypothetical protein
MIIKKFAIIDLYNKTKKIEFYTIYNFLIIIETKTQCQPTSHRDPISQVVQMR